MSSKTPLCKNNAKNYIFSSVSACLSLSLPLAVSEKTQMRAREHSLYLSISLAVSQVGKMEQGK